MGIYVAAAMIWSDSGKRMGSHALYWMRTVGDDIDLPEGTPIVLSGDLNLVGESQVLKTLLTGDIQNEITFGKGGLLDWDDICFSNKNQENYQTKEEVGVFTRKISKIEDYRCTRKSERRNKERGEIKIFIKKTAWILLT